MNVVIAGEGPVVFIDRDGVIIRNRADYVKSWSEVELVPGAVDAMAKLHRNGYRVAVITNQSAIGRGVVPARVVDDIHRRLAGRVEDAGGRIEAFFVCPHTPEDHCACRKPKPGLLSAAKHHMNVESSAPYMIGDQFSDVEAALGAGCRPILLSSVADRPPLRDPRSSRYGVAPDLAGAVDFLILAGGGDGPTD
jgi:D-glycero-D-manno-heptose 1,7-bisphosphate phosphatase